MTDTFGIDLGTTYSAIAYINENDLPEIIRNSDSIETTPSVVFLESDSNTVIGQEAKNGAVIEPGNTISLIKRRMGDTEFRIEFHGTVHSPESISSLILKQLVQTAQESTGILTNKVVITVPAYFGILEKEATRTAGEIAGLEVVGIVTEPVAAAISYLGTGGREETIFVYDLGGGTFDTTVLQSHENQPLDVVVIGGDRKLGGADWDARLIELMVDRFRAEVNPEEDPMDDDVFVQDVTSRAEILKKSLSARETASQILNFNGDRAKIEISRSEFEQATNDLLLKTLNTVQSTLDDATAKVPGLTVDSVLLVGGSSRMPAVSEALMKQFGFESRLTDPDLAVAKGAAIYATLEPMEVPVPEPGPDGESVLRTASRPPVNNVLPKGLGVQFYDPERDLDYIHFLFNPQDSIPDSKSQNASTSHDGTTSINVLLFEQVNERISENPADNRELHEGGVTITGLPDLPKGSPIKIGLQVDHQGLATLEAYEPATGQRLSGQVKVATMSDEERDNFKAAVSKLTVE